jgi:hypothetical protein
MKFSKQLRPRVVSGEVTCSTRIWKGPRVKVGGHYPLEDGHIVVTRIRRIGISDITPELARASGFAGVVDLLKIARHGKGQNAYLVDFVFQG